MYHLLIWQEIPETISVYSFSHLFREEAEKLVSCHNRYVNAVTLEGSPQIPKDVADWLTNFLQENSGSRIYSEADDDKPENLEKPLEFSSCLPKVEGPHFVIVSGILL